MCASPCSSKRAIHGCGVCVEEDFTFDKTLPYLPTTALQASYYRHVGWCKCDDRPLALLPALLLAGEAPGLLKDMHALW